MRKEFITALTSLACSLVIAAVPLHASSVFINGDVALGTATGFQDTNNGVTAAFSSNGDPDGFETANSLDFFTWPSEALVSNGIDLTLTIQFYSDPGLSNRVALSGIQMNFGTADDAPLELNAFLGGPGGSSVGSSQVTGTLASSNYEGIIGFSGASFDTIQLTVLTSSPDQLGLFGVGNIVDAVVAPEPGYFWMFPVIGISLAMWKRRSQLS